jgi:hypothetical protein
MKQIGLPVCCLAGGLLLSAAAPARGENPYESIVERNAFALKPPPPPPPPAEDPRNKKDPPAKVVLTGITILDHQKKAWFSLTEGKTPNAQPKYVSLREGQRSGDLEVLEIHEKTGEVKIAHAGENTTVALKDNKGKGVAINISGAPPPGAGVVGGPIGRPGAPSNVPGPAGAPQPGFRRQFGGGGRNGGNSPIPQPQPIGQPGLPGATGMVVEPPVSPTFEQAVQNVETQRAVTQEAVNAGQLPPLPPLPPEVQNAIGGPPQLPSFPQFPSPGGAR